MNYLDYFKNGNKIPDKYISSVKDLKGKETDQQIIRSSDARLLMDLSDLIKSFKIQLDYDRKLEEIAPKNNKINSSSSTPSIYTTIQLLSSGQKYLGFPASQWSLSNFSTNNF